jgi:hypothetical protein
MMTIFLHAILAAATAAEKVVSAADEQARNAWVKLCVDLLRVVVMRCERSWVWTHNIFFKNGDQHSQRPGGDDTAL